MQVLTDIQKLVPDSQTREIDRREAQFHDDKTLFEETRTQIEDTLKDPNGYVSMYHELFVIDLVHRFPTYVNDIKAPLNELQNAVISGSSPEVSAYPHKSVLVLTYWAQWLMVLAIRTSMLIQGVLEMVKATKDIETRNHLKSEPVWKAALEYASLFLTFLDLFRA